MRSRPGLMCSLAAPRAGGLCPASRKRWSRSSSERCRPVRSTRSSAQRAAVRVPAPGGSSSRSTCGRASRPPRGAARRPPPLPAREADVLGLQGLPRRRRNSASPADRSWRTSSLQCCSVSTPCRTVATDRPSPLPPTGAREPGSEVTGYPRRNARPWMSRRRHEESTTWHAEDRHHRSRPAGKLAVVTGASDGWPRIADAAGRAGAEVVMPVRNPRQGRERRSPDPRQRPGREGLPARPRPVVAGSVAALGRHPPR